jgi:hypothetical protein
MNRVVGRILVGYAGKKMRNKNGHSILEFKVLWRKIQIEKENKLHSKRL